MNHVMLHQNANVSALNKSKSSVIVLIGGVTHVSVKKLKSKKLKFLQLKPEDKKGYKVCVGIYNDQY